MPPRLCPYTPKQEYALHYPLVFRACNDMEAYSTFKEACFAYNKLWLCHVQKVTASPAGLNVFPPNTKLVRKPVYNLAGMAVGTKRMLPSEVNGTYDYGCMYMPWLDGAHLSLDFVTNPGCSPTLLCAWRGYVRSSDKRVGIFDRWVEVSLEEKQFRPQFATASAFIQQWLPTYRGMLNIEVIGNVITECHLRPGDITFLAPLRRARVCTYASFVLRRDVADAKNATKPATETDDGVQRLNTTSDIAVDVLTQLNNEPCGYILTVYLGVPRYYMYFGRRCFHVAAAFCICIGCRCWSWANPADENLADPNAQLVIENTYAQPQPPASLRACIIGTTTNHATSAISLCNCIKRTWIVFWVGITLCLCILVVIPIAWGYASTT